MRIQLQKQVAAPVRPAHVLALVLIIVMVAGCGGGASVRDSTAGDMMPNLSGYTITNTLDIQTAIANVVGAASLAAAQPQITGLIAAVSGLARCYQEAGAVEGRVYISREDPFLAGVIVIINRNQLLNPAVLTNCIGGGGRQMAPLADIQPCARVYTLQRDNNEFYIAYVATNPEVCTAFCSGLPGCTQ
jgi:hypothetical protein